MSDNTKISWTDSTWNPIVGCTIVSPGCTNCYAMRDAARIIRCSNGAGRPSHYEGTIQPSKAGPVWTGKVARAPDHILTQPLSWRRPRRIFVNSMGDLFHESVPDEWIDRVFAVMALAPQHTFQILTKRARRMREYLTALTFARIIGASGGLPAERGTITACNIWKRGIVALPNVWLGVTAEDQQRADERIPDLLMTPAALRWVSVEPMLGAIDLETAWNGYSALNSECWGECNWCTSGHPPLYNCQRGRQSAAEMAKWRSGLDWVVCGGESGPAARPMHPDWARSLRDQCKAAGVPFHFKQWGEWLPVDEPASEIQEDRELRGTGAHFHRVGKLRAGHLLDGVEHREFPGGTQ